MCSEASLVEKTNSLGSLGSRYDVIPEKPRKQPVNEFVVTPVYEITSL